MLCGGLVFVCETSNKRVLTPAFQSPPPPQELWLVEYKSRVGPKDIRRMARDSLQLGVYSLAVRRLLGRAPSRLVIESIEDGRIGKCVCACVLGGVWKHRRHWWVTAV